MSLMRRVLSRLMRSVMSAVERREPNVHATIPEVVAAHRQEWEAAVAKAKGGPKVLIPTAVTGFQHVTTVESMLGAALTLRGAEVHYLVCDAALPACFRAESDRMPSADDFRAYRQQELICPQCVAQGKAIYDPMGLPVHALGKVLTQEQKDEAKRISETIPYGEIKSFTMGECSVGEHAIAGALRYYARGDIDAIPGSEVVVRRYLESAIRSVHATRGMIEWLGGVHSAVFHHGIYVPMGLIGEVCRERGVPLSNWNPSYRQNTFIFSHGDTYHHTLMDEPVETWTDMTWSETEAEDIMAYLKSRMVGTRDWIWFHEKPDEDFESYAAEIGIDRSKPIVGMLTNVMWDAQLHYPANAFPGMLEWVLDTIRWFAEHPELQLLVRVHPAEIRGTAPSKQPIVAEIAKVFPKLPGNVFVIPPESQTSTYAAMAACDSAIIYGTKMGVELTSVGIPVIVGGEAWIRNKGLTEDARSRKEYFRLLSTLPKGRRLDRATVERAHKYAYHFFFRRMVPLPFLQPVTGKTYKLRLSGLDDLKPGRYPGLDVICDGILNGAPYVYQAERLGLHDKDTT